MLQTEVREEKVITKKKIQLIRNREFEIQTYFIRHAVDIHPHSSMPITEYEVVLKLQDRT